jgi:hypothetical protein
MMNRPSSSPSPTTAPSPHFSSIEEVLLRCANETFQAPDTRERREPTSLDEYVVVATIGFAGQCVRGNVTLVAPCKVVGMLQPFQLDPSETEVVVCDVLGEMGNMLVGRLKNRLLARGLTLFSGLPTSGLARKMRLKAGEGTASAWHRFVLDNGPLFLRLNATFDDGFALLDEPAEKTSSSSLDAGGTAPVGAEGEMMFF